jgi:membrane protein required for beta-lactamase induction
LIRSAPRIIQATAFTLLAAGLAALAFAALSLLWFVVGVVLCGTLALVAEVLARRDAARAKHEEAARAHAARLAELRRTSDTLKARERAVERVQMEVLEGVRREHGL